MNGRVHDLGTSRLMTATRIACVPIDRWSSHANLQGLSRFELREFAEQSCRRIFKFLLRHAEV